MENKYASGFVNLTAKKDYLSGEIAKETCPLFDGEEVRVYIKERETTTGKKIKGSLVVQPTEEVNQYGDVIGKNNITLWENVSDEGKVSWSGTYEKGMCWIALHQRQTESATPEYFLRVSWNKKEFDSMDTSNDKIFGEDDTPTEPNMDLPF